MSVGIGSKSKLVFVVESAFGTFPSGQTGTNLGFLTEAIQNTRNTFSSQEISSSRQLSSVRGGNVAAGGDISMELSPNALGTFVKHLLCVSPTTASATITALANSQAVLRGAYISSNTKNYLCTRAGTTSGTATTLGFTSTDTAEEFLSGTATFQYVGAAATTVYSHTFQAAVSKPTGGIAVEREVFLDSGSKFFRYVGGRINTMAITVPQEGIVTCSFGFLFLDLDSTATSTIFSSPTTPVDEPFSGAGTVMRIAASGGSLTEDFSIDSATINVTNNFDGAVYTIGQRRRRDLPEQMRSVTGNLSAVFEDMTKFNFFANETTVSLEVSFNHLGQFMRITMPEVRLHGGAPAPVISGNGVMKHTFDFTAFKSTGAGDIKIEMFNTTSSYA